MTSLRRRLAELEKKLDTGARAITLCCPNADGTITVNGETISREEHRRRCKAEGITLIELTWPEHLAESE